MPTARVSAARSLSELADDDYKRARSVSEVVASKKKQARKRMREQRNQQRDGQKDLSPSPKDSPSLKKRPVRPERSLSLPVISVEIDCCSFLTSDPDSPMTDDPDKISNPYLNIADVPLTPREPNKGLMLTGAQNASAQVPDSQAPADIKKTTKPPVKRKAPKLTVTEIAELTLSDPEGEFDSSEGGGKFLPPLATPKQLSRENDVGDSAFLTEGKFNSKDESCFEIISCQ